MAVMQHFNGSTFVVRLDQASLHQASALFDDLTVLSEHGVAPILVAPDRASARGLVRHFNRAASKAVCINGTDAATVPTKQGGFGKVQTTLLKTLLAAGFLPVLEPIGYAPFGTAEVEIDASAMAGAIAAATHAKRALFFENVGGIIDPLTARPIDNLTPAEALVLSEDDRFALDLRATMRAAALGVRGGADAAQIVDGRVAHVTIVELLTDQHLGTQVIGSVFRGGADQAIA